MPGIDDTDRSGERQQARQRVREQLKNWHPDKSPFQGREVDRINEMLNRLNNAIQGKETTDPDQVETEVIDNLRSWPGSFHSGDTVTFPKLTDNGNPITIPLPETPDEFLAILDYVHQHHALPLSAFQERGDLTKMSRREQEDAEREKRIKEGTLGVLGKLKAAIEKADNFGRLEGLREAVSDYTHEEILEAGIHLAIDGTALRLFASEFDTATGESELQAVTDRVYEYPFYDPRMYRSAIDLRDKRAREVGASMDLTRMDILGLKRLASEIATPTDDYARKMRADIDSQARTLLNEELSKADSLGAVFAVRKEMDNFPFFAPGKKGLLSAAITRKQNKLEKGVK